MQKKQNKPITLKIEEIQLNTQLFAFIKLGRLLAPGVVMDLMKSTSE